MKRFIPIMFVPIVFILLGGSCESEPEEALQPASNLQIEVTGNDSLSIKLKWDASPTSNIDGYVIRLNDVSLDNVTNIEYTHNNPTELGIYRVRAFRDDEESSAIQASTGLITATNQGPVWEFNAPVGYPSGFGWDEDGGGNTYSMVLTAKDSIDLWMGEVEPWKGVYAIVSPDAYPSSNWEDAHSTWFYVPGATNIDAVKIAPLQGGGEYDNYSELITNQVCVLLLQSGNFIKLKVTERDFADIQGTDYLYFKFEYKFQPVAGFRRLGDG